MKYIKLPQPYATALCYGYFNRVHIEDAPTDYYETIPVYATQLEFDAQTPVEILMEIHNEQLYGNLPPLEELPINAFIGTVGVYKGEHCKPNVWDLTVPEPSYPMVGAHVFEEPLYCGYPDIDVDVLKWGPSYTFRKSINPSYSHGLILEVNEETFKNALTAGTIVFDLTDQIRREILIDPDDENSFKPMESLMLACGKRQRSVFLDGIDILYELDSNGDPVLYPSIKSPDKRLMRVSALFHCRPEYR